MIIYGKQLFLHLLARHPKTIQEVYLSKECDKKLFGKIASLNVPIIRVDNKKAQGLAKGGNHQGFLLKIEDFKFTDFAELKKMNFIVVLYGLSDVGNIGAIIRTAYAMGAQGVLVIGKSLAIDGVLRASSASAFEIPISLVEDGLQSLNELKQFGFKIYATAMDGKPHNKIEFAPKIALVMGSEGDGMPKKALERCDEIVGIKMKHGWDSLNVSSAFAIICDRIVNG